MISQQKINRRKFLKTGSAALTALALTTPSCMLPKESPYLKTIGLQLWTVRDQMAKDPVATLKAIKEHGYYQVEAGDTAVLPDIAPIAKDLGLAIHSSFMNWTYLTERWDLKGEEKPKIGFESIIEAANKYELSHLVFGYMMPQERSTLDDYKRISDKLNVAGEQCKKAGIQLTYHNHSFEFLPLKGSTGFDILTERLDPALVKFELDVFWTSIGGVEPVALMKELGSRVGLVHLKDKLDGTPIIYDESKVPEAAFKELGNGVVDLKGVIAQAEAAGVPYCMVEQDQSPDPIESIGTSIQYLG